MVPPEVKLGTRRVRAGARVRRPRHEMLTPGLLLLGPVIHLLRSHGYSLLRTEVLLLSAAVLLAGAVVGWIIRTSGTPVRLMLMALVLSAVVDLYVQGGTFQRAALLLIAMGSVVVVFRAHMTTIAFAIAIAVLLSTIVLPPAERIVATSNTWPLEPTNTALPPVFHIVLDEHSGMSRLEAVGGATLSEDMEAWYERRGFRWYPNAYSPYFDTYNALANLVNLTAEPRDSAYLDNPTGTPPRLLENRYFERMRSRGYAVRVYQPDYLDFCYPASPAVQACQTYPANSIAYVATLHLPLPARTLFVANYILANQSYFFRRPLLLYQRQVQPALRRMGVPAPPWEWEGDRAIPPPGAIFDQLVRDAADGSRGILFFAHVVLPHYPYQYDAACQAHHRLRSRLDRHSPHAPAGQTNTPASRAHRYALYRAQLRCLNLQLEAFFARLDSLGLYRDAVIMLHGDHGTRIAIREPKGAAVVKRLTPDDLRDAYSTLFAVKAPGEGEREGQGEGWGLTPGPDTSTVTIIEAFQGLLESDFTGADIHPTGERRVFVVDAPGEAMIEVRYPDPGNSPPLE